MMRGVDTQLTYRQLLERCMAQEVALAALTKERDEAVRERDAYLERLRFEYKRMGTRIAALEKALRVFGRHNPDCLYHVNEPQSTVSQCTCGFSAALAGGKETK